MVSVPSPEAPNWNVSFPAPPVSWSSPKAAVDEVVAAPALMDVVGACAGRSGHSGFVPGRPAPCGCRRKSESRRAHVPRVVEAGCRLPSASRWTCQVREVHGEAAARWRSAYADGWFDCAPSPAIARAALPRGPAPFDVVVSVCARRRSARRLKMTGQDGCGIPEQQVVACPEPRWPWPSRRLTVTARRRSVVREVVPEGRAGALPPTSVSLPAPPRMISLNTRRCRGSVAEGGSDDELDVNRRVVARGPGRACGGAVPPEQTVTAPPRTA
jgi:hypothetical protein